MAASHEMMGHGVCCEDNRQQMQTFLGNQTC